MAGKKDKVKDSDRFTIMYPEFTGRCFICGSTDRVAKHEVFGGSFRDISKEDGMVIELCGPHHNLSSQGIHFNSELDLKIKKQAEKIWIMKYENGDFSKGVSKFIKRYGKNYLEEEDM